MTRGKQVRMRGKTPISRQFQSLKKGDVVAVIREIAARGSFPERLQGRTGIVAEKRGMSYIVEINDNGKEKKFIIGPVHLKKIQAEEK